MFFVVNAGTSDQLWVSDGTEAGTSLVYSFIRPAIEEPGIIDLTAVADGVLVLGYTAEFGIEPWFSNGSKSGTNLIRDLNPGRAGAEIRVATCCSYYFLTEFTPIANGVLFMAKGNTGNQIWFSDGNGQNTRQISNFAANNELITEIEAFNNEHIIVAVQQPEVVEIIKIELATGKEMLIARYDRFYIGTRLVVSAYNLTNIDGQVYYSVIDSEQHPELWLIDSQTVTTKINLGRYQFKRSIAGPVQSKLYLQLLNDNGSEAGLWQWDGANPQQLSPLEFQQVADNGQRIFGIAGEKSPYRVYANNPTRQRLQYAGSGFHTLSNSPVLAHISRFSTNHGIFIALPDLAHGLELWYSDGTTLRLVKDIRP